MMSDQVYKTGSDVRIFLTLAVNNHFIWVDDCLGLSFSESTQKTPVFGYASRFFDAVAEGPSLITGSITIALRAASTLSQLKSYGAIYQPQHAYPTYTEQDALKNAYWKQGTNSELGLTGSMETIHPPMAIVIAYGEYSSNAEFVVTSSKKIMDIHISNAQEGVAQDDSPLVRSYAFIGRKIVNDFGYVTPASSRSNGYDSVLAAGSSRSHDGSINWEDSDNPESHPTFDTEEAIREYEESLEDIPIGDPPVKHNYPDPWYDPGSIGGYDYWNNFDPEVRWDTYPDYVRDMYPGSKIDTPKKRLDAQNFYNRGNSDDYLRLNNGGITAPRNLSDMISKLEPFNSIRELQAERNEIINSGKHIPTRIPGMRKSR